MNIPALITPWIRSTENIIPVARKTWFRESGKQIKGPAVLSLGLPPSVNTDRKCVKSLVSQVSLFTSVGLSVKEPVSIPPERGFPIIRICVFRFAGMALFSCRKNHEKGNFLRTSQKAACIVCISSSEQGKAGWAAFPQKLSDSVHTWAGKTG